MKPERYSSKMKHTYNAPLLRQFWLLSGLGVIGTVLTLGALPLRAESEVEIEVKVEESVPTSIKAAPPVAFETSAEALLEPQVTATPTVEPLEPAPAPMLNPAPAPAENTRESVLPGQVAESDESVNRSNNALIDPTDYSLGATPSTDRPSLIFSDRSTGCQLTLPQGQSAPVQTCASGTSLAAEGSEVLSEGQLGYENAASDGSSSFSIGPVSVGGQGVTFGNTTVISREYFNDKLRTLNLLRQGAAEFVFPLAIPSPITSLFGWRTHPIFGDRRFHTGTDIGAPEGTPVVATKDGEVHVANYLGGYGLTVILRHAEGSLETRYAHLSSILVRPGEVVKQGEVVGLVGSTGNSTGPHLHFELRELTAQGWILHNPDELMRYTVANLVNVINDPLLALGLTSGDKTQESNEVSGKKFAMPYRPAQPNAN